MLHKGLELCHMKEKDNIAIFHRPVHIKQRNLGQNQLSIASELFVHAHASGHA